MNRHSILALVGSVGLLGMLTGIAVAQIPQTVSYQGLLQGAGGAPVPDGNYDLTFKLYDVPSGPDAALYTEAHAGANSVAVSGGVFNVILGSLTALTLPFDEPYWLGITVGIDPELTPRIQLTSSPYALNAKSLMLPFGGITSYAGPAVHVESGGNGDNAAGLEGWVFSGSASPTALVSGVRGVNHRLDAVGCGVSGHHQGWGAGVRGEAIASLGGPGGPGGTGVLGIARLAGGAGIRGQGNSGALAGRFEGDVEITGTLTKGAGAFKIDHPLDPANRYLSHSFVESPDMMNVYNGNAVLDERGEASVELPSYFEALNRDFRYQLTAIGAPGPDLHVAEEVHAKRFRIAGGRPGLKVSWQVTGIRQDATANAHRIVVEEMKPAAARGTYLDPAAFGLPGGGKGR